MEDNLPEPPGIAEGLTREEREEEFLRLLSQGNTVRAAAAGVALPFNSLYRKKHNDPAFARRWEDAQRIKVDHLIAEAERRAMKGSDKLLMFLLTNYVPDRFKSSSQRVEVTNPDGSLTDNDRAAKVAAILENARARKAEKAVGDLL